MRVNAYFDFVTGTGSAVMNRGGYLEDVTESRVNQPSKRIYIKRTFSTRMKIHQSNSDHLGALEKMDQAEALALQQEHDGKPVVGTPTKDLSKQTKAMRGAVQLRAFQLRA